MALFDSFRSTESVIDRNQLNPDDLIVGAQQVQEKRKKRFEAGFKLSRLFWFGLAGKAYSMIVCKIAKKRHTATEEAFAANILHLDRRVVIRTAKLKQAAIRQSKRTLVSKIEQKKPTSPGF